MSANTPQRLIDVVGLYFDIARLRRGPEDLPARRSLLVATIIAYGILSLAFGALLPPQDAHPLLPLIVDTALMLVWLQLLLRIARKPERFVQTTMAIYGTQLVLAPLFAGAMALYLRLHDDPAWMVPVTLLVFALSIWALMVSTRILQSATQWPVFGCMSLVMAYALASYLLLRVIFPDLANSTVSVG